jgi:hypothetical protein
MQLFKLPSELLYNTFTFLTNEEIINLTFIHSKFYKMIHQPFFREYISYRPHPLVFDFFGNMCSICNQTIYILDDNTKYIECGHVGMHTYPNKNDLFSI